MAKVTCLKVVDHGKEFYINPLHVKLFSEEKDYDGEIRTRIEFSDKLSPLVVEDSPETFREKFDNAMD